MNLGDAFSRRKQLDSEIEQWTARLRLTGRETRQYQTKDIEGAKKFEPIPGSVKEFARTYTVEECRKKLAELIEEDRDLAQRISLTNQKARATLEDLDGKKKEMTIPELLVLKNEIAPKLEAAVRAVPVQAKGVDVMETKDIYKKWRSISTIYKVEQSLSDKGHKVENKTVDYYAVDEVKDFGRPEREVFDEVDRIHAWLQRIKEAINEANKTELVPLQKK